MVTLFAHANLTVTFTLGWTTNRASAKGHAMSGSMDDFTKLPAELHVRVMMLLPDLPTLQHLIYASPILSATFEQNHVRVANIIMSGLTLELRQAMRAVAITLTECTDAPLIDGALFDNRGDSSEDGFCDVDERFGTPTLPSTLPLSTGRQFLLVSCRIQRVSDHYFATQIDRLNRIEAEHLLEEESAFDLSERDAYKDVPPGVAYVPQKTGPASWIERYRVECTLWRLQLLNMFGLCHGTIHSSAARSISEERSITSQDFMRMWHAITPWETDQMKALQEYMDKEFISMVYTYLEYLEGGYRHPDMELASTSASVLIGQAPLDVMPTGELARAWEQDRAAARRPTSARCLFGHGVEYPQTPIRGEYWYTFRRLGFGFWDSKRMCEMELLSGRMTELSPAFTRGHALRSDVGIRLSRPSCIFTWMSIKLDGKRIAGHKATINSTVI